MMSEELKFVYALLLDANEVALRRGDPHGLCDAIDDCGNPYPSQALADVIAKALEVEIFDKLRDTLPESRMKWTTQDSIS